MSLPKPPRAIIGSPRGKSHAAMRARAEWIAKHYRQGASCQHIADALGTGRDAVSATLRGQGVQRPKAPLRTSNLSAVGIRVGIIGPVFDDMPAPARDQLMRLAAKGRGTIAAALADHFLKSFVEDRA